MVAAAAVLAVMERALREYEVGPHLVIRLVRALNETAPATVADLLANAPMPMFGDGFASEDDAFAEVEPEELAEVVGELLTPLRVALSEAVPA